MKPRTQFLLVVGLITLIVGVTWLSYATRNQEPAQVFAATINRDCAPWDGSAFTVSIPYDSGSVINISIWQSPDIRLPPTFSFPDETGRVGNAVYLSPSGEYKQLSGKVLFSRVVEGSPVEDEFNFTSERGEQFRGRFIAEWENLIAMCG